MADELPALIDELLEVLRSSEHDTIWTRFESGAELIAEVERVSSSPRSQVEELKRLLAPTGPLQEVAMASGWAPRYLDLAAGLDRCLDEAPEPR